MRRRSPTTIRAGSGRSYYTPPVYSYYAVPPAYGYYPPAPVYGYAYDRSYDYRPPVYGYRDVGWRRW